MSNRFRTFSRWFPLVLILLVLVILVFLPSIFLFLLRATVLAWAMGIVGLLSLFLGLRSFTLSGGLQSYDRIRPRPLPTTQSPAGQDSAPPPETAPAAQPAAPHGSPGKMWLLEERGQAIWKVGDLIDDKSEVREILGEGGMGTVYKVYYRPWKQHMAVKCPRPELFARADGKARFIQEAETWTALGAYLHVVRGYFVQVTNGIPYVFAEYVQGGSLSDWITRRRLYAGGPQQALSRILDIAIQFAWGLHFAHEQGLVHQDVKPANVMMTEYGMAKVTDFGLAKARLLAGESSITVGSGKQSLLVSSHGMTPAYCSPEQAAGRPLNRQTDIWSWGVSVLEMFVGAVTWRVGVVAREVLVSDLGEDPEIPEMPAALKQVLSRCFQQEPEARPATMLAVATELQTIYEQCVGRSYPRARPETPEMDAHVLVNRGISLAALGRPAEALTAFEQALRLNPNDATAHMNRGAALAELGQRAEALAAYGEALRLNPNDATAHTNQGNALARLGRRAEALAAYEQSIHLDPNYAKAQYNRGNALTELGRPAEALVAFEQALRLNPNLAEAHHGRGIVLTALGRSAEALAALEQALRLNPDLAEAHNHRGAALRDLGRSAEALAAFEQAAHLDPNNAKAHNNRGAALLDLGRPAKALAAFEQSIRLDPNDAEAHNNRGIVLRELGRRAEAKLAFQKAQDLRGQR